MGRAVRAVACLLLLLLVAASPQVEADLASGDQAWDRGDIATALVRWSEALATARTQGDDEALVESSLRLAAAHRELGRVDTAAKVLDDAARHAPDPAAEARLLVARGQVALARGDPREAERLLTRAFEAHRSLEDVPGAAGAAIHLGLARLAAGRHDDARKAFAAAESLYTSLGDDVGRADALTDHAIADLRDGRLQEARVGLEAAIGLYRGADHRIGVADAGTNLGRVFQELGRDDLAADLYRSALATARARRDLPRQGALLQNLGTLAHRAGDLPEADAMYAGAMEAWHAAGRPAEALTAALNRASLHGDDPAPYESVLAQAEAAERADVETMAHLDLAALYRARDAKKARTHAASAVRLARDLGREDLSWRARYVDGLLALDRGDQDAGIASLRAAVDELERTRRGLDDDDAAAFVFGHGDVYEALIGALLAQGDSTGAFLYAERLAVVDLPAPPTDALGADADRLHELEREQAWVDVQLSASARDSEQQAALRERQAALRVEFAATVDGLRASHPEFDRMTRLDPEDLEAVQADLDPGVAVLQPILLEDRLALLVFRRDRLVAHSVDVDAAEVTSTVGRLARSLRAGMTSRPEWTEQACDQLGEWLITPVAEELDGADTLVVSLGGPFRQLPFGIVRHDGKWLVEEMAVAGITHVGSLSRRSAADAAFHVDGPGLLLVGNPDGSLPGAEQEVQAIADRFPGATVLMAGAGTVEALRASASGKRAVHLATHGRIDPQRPARSHLVLADDGRLAYGEIPGLAPYLATCRLVVLSACESGLPVEAQEAAEGEVIVSINGLSAQFRRAGVETLVASLWQVDDESTRALMVRLYEELGRGSDTASALRTAQLSVMSDDRWSHPWYWGGFVVMGDWR